MYDESKSHQQATKVHKQEGFMYNKFSLASNATVEKPTNKLKRKAEIMLAIANKKKKQMELTREKNPEKADRFVFI